MQLKVQIIPHPLLFLMHVKASFSFTKIIPKSTQLYTLYNNVSFYITFTMFHYIRKG